MEIHFLKITWGDIIILKQDNNVAMIDAGFDGNFYEIKDYFEKLGVKKIDFILLTHFHRDHYGAIPKIVENFKVDKVYFKDYSGLDSITAVSTVADDNYRNDEMRKCNNMKETIRKYSQLIAAEDVDIIKFGTTELKLYANKNTIKEVYEDKSFKDTYHKILFSENYNSLAAFMKINGVNVFFGGDLFDREGVHPKVDFINYQIATQINEQIDIYKAPHHGTPRCSSEKALAIYKPKITVITCDDEYLKTKTTTYDDLKKANKDAKVYLTEKHNIVIKISDDGKITCEEN